MNPADLTARSTTVRTEEGPARLSVSHVTKLFQRQHGDLVRAIDDVSFDVREGELLVLLGPSGCGKSTLLRSIAGLESPTEGRISISGEDVYEASKRINRSPDNRDVNMMFQSYALWPHMTLEDNVAYPLRTAGVGRSAARSRARDYLELVGLEGLGQQHPGLISGGQQQRVALARTLISEPSIVLFDEPLSNVDARIKVKLRSLLVRLHQQLGFAAVYVTHDQVEAMGLGTRIAVMRHGRVDQLASPVTVYESPSNRATAEFVGEATFWEGTVIGRDGGAVLVDVAEGQLRVPLDAWPSGIDPEVGDHPTLMVRPEKCTLTRVEASESDPHAKPWHGVVASRTFAGAHTEYQVQMRDQLLSVWAFGAPDPALRESTQVTITIPEGALRVVADD